MDYRILSKYRPELMGCAMAGVLLFHLREVIPSPVLRAAATAGMSGVDMFLLLSCVGLVLSLGRRRQTYGAYLARRARRILPAYFAVMVPYTLWEIARGAAGWSALLWNSSLLYYWVRAPGGFNWYISGIMLFYALLPPCLALLERARRPLLWTAGGILAGWAVCRIMMADGYWWYIDVLYRLPIFCLGLQTGCWVREGRPIGRRDAAGWTAWLAAGGVYLPLSLLVDREVFYLPLCHLFLFTTVPVCLILCLLFEKLPLGWVRRGLRLLGDNSLEIYLLNVSLFAAPEALPWFAPGSVLWYILFLAANIALGVLLRRAVGRLLGLSKLFGRGDA